MTKPNILFIIADDQRADSLDWDFLPRPGFDSLVRNGTRFKNSFVHVPICTPGRAECLTGCHGYRNEVMWFNTPINPSRKLLPKAFQEAGYHTIHVGKWHNDGHPRDKGYDRVRLNMHDADDFYSNYKQKGHWLTFSDDEGSRTEGHSTEIFSQAAIDEIDTAPDDKPWFCWLALHSPHDPFHCPPPFDGLFENAKDFPLPPAYQAMPVIDNGDLTIRDELLLPHPRTPEAARRNFARYAAMIAHHDHWIDRIIQTLEDSGQLENTVICFTSDHGLAVGSNGFLGKENMYDHSCRVPLILSGPGIPCGQTVEDLTTSADLYPTLCSLAGIPTPASVQDGKSLLPLLQTDASPLREAVFSAFRSPQMVDGERQLADTQRSVRTATHKLNWYPLNNRFQFFSLQQDPFELDDLLQPWRCREDLIWGYAPPISRELLEEQVNALKTTLVDFLTKQGDPLAPKLKALNPLL
jgi:arylsulfatase A-like enzyme